MKRIRLISLLVALLAGLVWGNQADAQTQGSEVVARVLELEKSALAIQDAMPRVLSIGDDIQLGDVISTGVGARIHIEMVDGSVFKLGERTHFVVLELVMGNVLPSMTTQVIQGAFQAVSGQIAALGGNMVVETQGATIGIRGTTVWGGMLDDVYEVALIGGKEVTVQTRADQVTLSNVGEGTAIASKSAIPTTPVYWSDEKIQRAIATISLNR